MTFLSKRVSQKRERRGAAAVEFAIVSPLLFLFIFMMIEASRFLMGLHATTGAAREAVRVFAVRNDQAAAENVALEYLRNSYLNIDKVKVDFESQDSAVSSFTTTSCTVEVDYKDVSLINDPFNLGANHVRGYAAILAPKN